MTHVQYLRSDTDRGSVSELEDALHGVDGDDHGLGGQFGPGNMDAQLVDVSAQEHEGQLELLQTHSLSVREEPTPARLNQTDRTEVTNLQASSASRASRFNTRSLRKV